MKVQNSFFITHKNNMFQWINTVAKKTQSIFGEKKLKTWAKSWKNSGQIPKKLENRQFELSWYGGKVSKNKPCI